jgi:hypothetical protein
LPPYTVPSSLRTTNRHLPVLKSLRKIFRITKISILKKENVIGLKELNLFEFLKR